MKVQRRHLCLAAAGAALLPMLSACSTAARQLEAAPGATYWSGRMSVQVLDSPPQSTSGSFELSGSPASGELVLLNPLGNIVARVQWSPGQASAQQGTQTRQASSLDELTQSLLGTSLPIAALFDWLRQNIWQHGSRFTTEQLITQATGETLNSRHFRTHLESRYL